MAPTHNKQWILVKRPGPGPIQKECFDMRETKLPELKDGQYLVKIAMLSFDPTQRFWMEQDTYVPAVPLGSVMRSIAAGEVIASKSQRFPVGSVVSGVFGWQTYAVLDEEGPFQALVIPKHITYEEALSVLGLTGLTAYFGIKEVAKPAAGDVVLVSGAAGATGSVAAQIARIMGAKVIGIAGSKAKCQWLKDKAHIDATINYREENIGQALTSHAPNGVNVFFDNVGGSTLDTALSHLAHKARVVLCGAISTYEGQADAAIRGYLNLVLKRATMEGFLIFDYAPRFPEAVAELARWVQERQIVYETDVQLGLENAPETLQRLFTGQNLGKQLLKV